MTDFIPIIAISWFLYFLKYNRINNPLVGLLFVSYLFFATNYSNFGLELNFDIFRSLHRIIGITCILVFLMHAVKYKVNILNEWVPKMLILFFLVLLLSFIGNEIYLDYYIHYIRNFVFISLIVLFLYYKVDSQDKLDELFKLIGMATLLLSLFVAFQTIIKGWGVRETLFFSNPNYLGMALFPGFTILLFSTYRFSWVLSLVVLFAIFSSGSRAVEVACIFVLLLFVYSNIKQFNIKYLILAMIFCIGSSVLFFDKIVLKKDISNVRFVISKIVVNILKENPINGIGYGQFKKSFTEYIDEDILKIGNNEINYVYLANNPDSYTNEITFSSLSVKNDVIKNNPKEKMTHNDLFTVLAELGLVGFLFILFLFYKLYIELKRLLIHSRNNCFLSISLISGILIFSMFHNNLTSFIFWFIIFLPFIMNRNYDYHL
jgi:hypothetical protein